MTSTSTHPTQPGRSADGGARGVAVELTGLRRSYGDVHALDDLTLRLAPGELVALLGPSGCGKTTALRCLAGLEDPDEGRIEVDGRDLTRVPTNKRDLGMVFQAYSLFPHMTARQNVEFGLQLRRQPGQQRRSRAAEMLELVGLSTQADRYAHQMSGGQQQRVALARALAIEPQVLLLDEPLSALDAKVRVQLRDEIRRIQLEVGTTTLFVTHDQEEALAVADRVGVMRGGRLEQIASPEELYSRPVNDFVADFVGVTNRLHGQSHGTTATVLGASIPLLPGSAPEGAATVLVRPEHLTVALDPAGPGTVLSASFLGAHGRVVVDPGGAGQQVIVQVPSGSVADFAPGATVTLRPTGDPALAVAGTDG
ncbi:spermidine/putrescine ABC transporter ATP-binding protein [Phycicoccus sp. Root563]|uniref:ABC transporter ATP-binding protein n=1 Tax=unclassified Phycicoccus TaxID=2637926 RepID=UPI000702B58A|nr:MULTISPECIES: ABC transporter ATP-binding protein [unclassified Phycicoccus]KQU69329.1 spermidine/putrescine ABC transporter ATP-binding protein [Phycicoccus sp. Root101]KQZ90533.1 spermidine/putrescine ABC transporter ATP-binding protein [Phycicoccus sp. Root563]